MSASRELINALRASYVPWSAHEGQLTAVFTSPTAMTIIVLTDGRTFVTGPMHSGAWRWWPWDRWRVAKAARERYARETGREAKDGYW